MSIHTLKMKKINSFEKKILLNSRSFQVSLTRKVNHNILCVHTNTH